MKRSLVLAAIASALPGMAIAQSSVTLYGIADGGVGVADRGDTGGDAPQVYSGVQSTSRFGLRGTEDLGAGMKAVFGLEAGVGLDDGSSDATGSGLFQRRSVVGLEGGFGTVLLGRDNTPGYHTASIGDVFNYGLFGSLHTVQSPWGTSVGNSGSAQISAPASNLGFLNRASNAIHYLSPSIAGGLRLRAMYSTSERTADTPTVKKNAGNTMAVSAAYVSGPLSLQAYLHDIKNNAGESDYQYGIGGGYRFGAVRVHGGYYVADPDSGAVVKQTAWNLGVGVKLGAGELLAQLVQQKLDMTSGPEQEGDTIGLGYTYPMSKRTNLYVAYGQTRNNGAGTFGLRSGAFIITPAVAGDDPTGFAAGIRHTF